MGALITESHLQKVLGYVEAGKTEGAKLVCGGERVQPGGDFSGMCFRVYQTDVQYLFALL